MLYEVITYEAPRCYLTRPAAEALRQVQEALRPFGLGLKVFDAYRPQRAVDHFVRWAKDLNDTKMKAVITSYSIHYTKLYDVEHGIVMEEVRDVEGWLAQVLGAA